MAERADLFGSQAGMPSALPEISQESFIHLPDAMRVSKRYSCASTHRGWVRSEALTGDLMTARGSLTIPGSIKARTEAHTFSFHVRSSRKRPAATRGRCRG